MHIVASGKASTHDVMEHGGYDNSHPIHGVHDVIYVHDSSKSNDLGVFTILRYRPI